MRDPLRSLGTVLRRFVALVPVLIAVTTLPIALLALFNAGFVTAIEILVVGWLLLTPVAVILAWIVLDLSPVDLPWSLGERGVDLPALGAGSGSGLDTGSTSEADGDDAVEVLRERFARGEIDQAEFERRLDQLLESEGASADDRPSSDRPSDRGSAVRRDREPESS